MPHLTDHDLRQMDKAWLESLPEATARAVLRRVGCDLKEARDRLNQTPQNSSRPPGSQPAWEHRRASATAQDDAEEPVGEQATSAPAGTPLGAVTTAPETTALRGAVRAPAEGNLAGNRVPRVTGGRSS